MNIDPEGKWCPFTRILIYGEGGAGVTGVNRWNGSTLPPHALCIGPHCAMYREEDGGSEVIRYCGLAGRPS